MNKLKSGFTLIELSIALLVIGLVVGSIMVGINMIEAAKIRSQISQFDKYTTAIRTFELKYNCLPGDCKDAAAFGFPPTGLYGGQGDGDGVIEGYVGNWADQNTGTAIGQGETMAFWIDLSMAGLIEGKFSKGSRKNDLMGGAHTSSSTSPISDYIPRAKLGNETYVYLWTDSYTLTNTHKSYFTVSNVFEILGWTISSHPGVTVQQAYNIDSKIDDGLPLSGTVQPLYLAYNIVPNSYYNMYAQGPARSGPTTTSPTTGSATTCYDNGDTPGATQKYSLNQNGGNGINCAIAFQWQ